MRILICPYSRRQAWCEQYFPDISVGSLPVVGKPYVFHCLDIVSQLGGASVRILDYEFDKRLQTLLCGGERWTLPVEYVGVGLCQGVCDMLRQNASFMSSEDVLVFYGPVLPRIAALTELLAQLEPTTEGEAGTDGLYLVRGGKLYRCAVPLFRLDSLRRYYDCNLELLSTPLIYVLPGYSNENGIHLGMNVVLERGCDLKPPVLLGDTVSLGRQCALSHGVILGHDVFVGRETELESSIIMEHTIIGNDMELVGKIVNGRRIIDVQTGEFVDCAGFGVLRGGSRHQWKLGCLVTEYLLALLLALLFFLPYVFFSVLSLVWRRTLWGYKWGVDRYRKYWEVLLFRRHLLKRDSEDSRYVFHVSEAFPYERTSEQRALDECYYWSIRSIRSSIAITFRCIANRWFTNECPKG